jgi:outer membrane protein with beta-barrel domain
MHTLLFSLFVASLPISALTAQGPRQGPIGLGVAINASTSEGTGAVAVRVPLRVATHWRLEPSLLFDFTSSSQRSFTNAGTDNTDVSVRVWGASMLLAYRMFLDSAVSAYLGPRLEVHRVSVTQELSTVFPTESVSYSLFDKSIAIVAGGELGVGAHLSLGGEVHLAYTFLGSPSVDPTPIPPGIQLVIVDGGHEVSTGGALVLRWFFGE